MSCAAPRFLTVPSADVTLEPDARIISLDMATGERFEFDIDGARLTHADSIVFGRTEGGSFYSVPMRSIRSIDCDSNGAIRMIRNHDGLSLPFQSAQVIRKTKLISGRATNGEDVAIPVSVADKVTVMQNYTRVRNDVEAKRGFTTLGIIAVAISYLVLEFKYGSTGR